MNNDNKNTPSKATVSTVNTMSPLVKKLRLILLVMAVLLLACVLGLQVYNYLKNRQDNQNKSGTNATESNNTNKQPVSEDPPKESNTSSVAPPEGSQSVPEPPKVQVTE